MSVRERERELSLQQGRRAFFCPGLLSLSRSPPLAWILTSATPDRARGQGIRPKESRGASDLGQGAWRGARRGQTSLRRGERGGRGERGKLSLIARGSNSTLSGSTDLLEEGHGAAFWGWVWVSDVSRVAEARCGREDERRGGERGERQDRERGGFSLASVLCSLCPLPHLPTTTTQSQKQRCVDPARPRASQRTRRRAARGLSEGADGCALSRPLPTTSPHTPENARARSPGGDQPRPRRTPTTGAMGRRTTSAIPEAPPPALLPSSPAAAAIVVAARRRCDAGARTASAAALAASPPRPRSPALTRARQQQPRADSCVGPMRYRARGRPRAGGVVRAARMGCRRRCRCRIATTSQRCASRGGAHAPRERGAAGA